MVQHLLVVPFLGAHGKYTGIAAGLSRKMVRNQNYSSGFCASPGNLLQDTTAGLKALALASYHSAGSFASSTLMLGILI